MYLTTRVTLYIPPTHATFLLEQPRGIARGYQGCALARQLPRVAVAGFFLSQDSKRLGLGGKLDKFTSSQSMLGSAL